MNKKYQLFILSLFLVLLVFSAFYRNTSLASKTTDNYVMKWYQDKWTGVNWTAVYSNRNAIKYPSNLVPSSLDNIYYSNSTQQEAYNKIIKFTKSMTTVWCALMVINLLLMIVTITRKEVY